MAKPKTKQQSAPRRIEIPAITLGRLELLIAGDTALITDRFSESSLASIEDKQKQVPTTGRGARNPDKEFREALYLMPPNGKRRVAYGFPACGIKQALVKAGGRFANETMTVLRGVINIPADLLEIEAPAPTMRTDRVRLNGGTTSVAYRPQFWPWQIRVPVLYNEALITEAQVLNLFNIAGFAVGIGSWRPELNGNFGQFKMKDVKRLGRTTSKIRSEAA